jgi:hypothetical protein
VSSCSVLGIADYASTRAARVNIISTPNILLRRFFLTLLSDQLKVRQQISMLSELCHFHGLPFAPRCWINRNATERNAPHPRSKRLS